MNSRPNSFNTSFNTSFTPSVPNFYVADPLENPVSPASPVPQVSSPRTLTRISPVRTNLSANVVETRFSPSPGTLIDTIAPANAVVSFKRNGEVQEIVDSTSPTSAPVQVAISNTSTSVPMSTSNIKGAPLLSKISSRTIDIYNSQARIYDRYESQEGPAAVNLLGYNSLDDIVVSDSQGGPLNFTLNPNNDIVYTPAGNKYVGQIVDHDSKTVTIMINGQKTIVRNYESLEMNRAQTTLITADLSRGLIISYVLPKLQWSAKAILSLSQNSLIINALITNHSSFPVSGQVNLVAGQPHFNQQSRSRTPMMAQMAAAPTENPNQEALEDYKIYTLPEITIERARSINLFSTSVQADKVYFHTLSSGQGSDNVSFGYKFVANHFLPAANIEVYSESGKLLGTSNIKESQATDKVEVIIGNSSLLKCQSVVNRVLLSAPDSEVKTYQDNLRVDMDNRSAEPATVVVKYMLNYGEYLQETTCVGSAPPQNQVVESTTVVEANSKNAIACSLTITSRY